MYIDIWTANESAAVDSATLPTSMTKYAVQSMAKVAAEGAAIEAAEKKEMILSFVLGVLFLLPSLGEAIDAAELATLGRAVSLVGDVGNIRASIYGIVEDPKSAVFAVFGLLVAGRSDPEGSMESAKVAWRESQSALYLVTRVARELVGWLVTFHSRGITQKRLPLFLTRAKAARTHADIPKKARL
ncbi:uncharacterized protein BDW70DRAFT_163287 [Aspergillus foveolatus]|uniref:uncharacterized protein n=1 Tax=Aspergillus foveolatus TaxID=210207 RepID=UPI003CCD02F9